MGKRKYQLPDNSDDRLLVEPVIKLAAEWDVPTAMLYARRTELRKRGLLSAGALSSKNSIRLDAETLAKVVELEPLASRAMREMGLPVRRLEPWQVVEWALNQALAQAKRSNIRALYAVKKDDSTQT